MDPNFGNFQRLQLSQPEYSGTKLLRCVAKLPSKRLNFINVTGLKMKLAFNQIERLSAESVAGYVDGSELKRCRTQTARLPTAPLVLASIETHQP